MKSIWKFPFIVNDHVSIMMPAGAEVLHVGLQNDSPTVWALVDTDAPATEYQFSVFGTGHRVDFEMRASRHIGTFQMVGGLLVFHMFQ
jgi:hypothetical protein